MPYTKKCLFSLFYPHRKPVGKWARRKRACLQTFTSRQQGSVFCKYCGKIAAGYRKRFQDFGIRHPENPYNTGPIEEPKEIKEVRIVNYREFRLMSPEKIVNLGQFGVDYTFLSLNEGDNDGNSPS